MDHIVEETNECELMQGTSFDSTYQLKDDSILWNKLNDKNCRLNFEEMMSIAKKIYNACQLNPQLNVIVGGFLLQILNAVNNTDSNKNELSMNNLVQTLSGLVHNYKNSFVDIK